MKNSLLCDAAFRQNSCWQLVILRTYNRHGRDNIEEAPFKRSVTTTIHNVRPPLHAQHAVVSQIEICIFSVSRTALASIMLWLWPAAKCNVLQASGVDRCESTCQAENDLSAAIDQPPTASRNARGQQVTAAATKRVDLCSGGGKASPQADWLDRRLGRSCTQQPNTKSPTAGSQRNIFRAVTTLWTLWKSRLIAALPYAMLAAWHSRRTPVLDGRTFPVLRSTCSWWVTTYVGKTSAIRSAN